MHLSESLPSAQPEKEIALTLYRAGASLRGKNLRKATWIEMAEFFQGRGAFHLTIWKRLRGSETRKDVLRVLRIIRKHSSKKKASNGGGARRWKTAAIQHDLETAWISGIELDECWNTTDPICRCGWGENCEGECDYTLTDGDRFSYMAGKIRDAYAPSAPWLIFPEEIGGPKSETLPGHRIAEYSEPIELRLSRHVQDAYKISENSEFERGMTEAIGGVKNLEIVTSAMGESECLDAVLTFAPFWIRSPVDWDGKTRLLDHLFVRHPVPECLYKEWTAWNPRIKWLCWFVLLAQNGNLHRAAKHFSWRITRRFQRHLISAPADLTPLRASMFAEVLRLGGTETDFQRLCHPVFAMDPTEPTDQPEWNRFWEETVRWFIASRNDIPDDLVPRILDWAIHEFTETTAGRHSRFAWKGRTASSVVRRSEEYHRLLSRPYANYKWQGHNWNSEYRTGVTANSADDTTQWSFVELTTGKELFEEGYAQQHCVASYASRCVAGRSAIVSLRRNGERCITVEICPATRTLVQARGKFNRSCALDESNIISRWLLDKVRLGDTNNALVD